MTPEIHALYAKLIEYPQQDITESINSLLYKLKLTGQTPSVIEPLLQFATMIGTLDLAKIQEIYTQTFDLSPVCSLHVGFHLFGESYKRGSLMALLKEEYAKVGMPETTEIPDHLALILNYCAILGNVGKSDEVYEELLSLLLFPAVEKMTTFFADVESPYKFLISSVFAWLTEQRSPVYQ